MAPEIVVVDLDLDVDGDYETFISALREKLAHHRFRDDYIAEYGAWLEDHPLLPEQRTPRQPARWMHINLKFQDLNTDETIGTTIAVRDDNVYYLIGFRNGNGQWYEFGFKEKSAPFIEGSTFLGCDLTYPELVGGSANLVDLNLGKHAAMFAVRRLWAYQQVVPADAATRKDLARMCVMICESARMMPHYNAVNDGWNNVGNRINLEHAGYITNWNSMSRRLLSNQGPDEEREHFLAVVHLLLNSPAKKGTQRRQQHEEQPPRPPPGGGGPSHPPGGGGPSQQRSGFRRRRRDLKNPQLPQTSSSRPASSSSGGTQQQGRTAGNSVRGRPLVEVYSVVLIDSDVVVDTIIIFDGKRGQIIYKHDDHAESRSRTRYRNPALVLTGPYRAISADGSFVIQVDGTIPGTDSRGNSSKVSTELFWDCYAKDVEYDKVLTDYVIDKVLTTYAINKKRKYDRDRTTDVISTDTGSRLAKVTYAVWSDAVEATVEVNLLLPGIIRVYGRISAWCGTVENRRAHVYVLPPEDRKEVVLFGRAQDEKVELDPSSADSMVPLELARSVIAVPVHSSDWGHMWIWVELHAATPDNEADVLLEGYIDFYFDKHTGEIRVDSYGHIFKPIGTSTFARYGHIFEPIGTSTFAGQESPEQTIVQQCKAHVNVTSPGFHISAWHWYKLFSDIRARLARH